MSRTPANLCISLDARPGIGESYVIHDRRHKKNIRCSSTCHRDTLRKGKFRVKEIRRFTGPEPFFTVKIGSLRAGFEVVKFLCGANHRSCLSEDRNYEWTGLTVSEARKQGVEFDEPGYVHPRTPATAAAPVAQKKSARKSIRKPVHKSPETETVAEPAPVPAEVSESAAPEFSPVAVMDDATEIAESVQQNQETVSTPVDSTADIDDFAAEVDADFHQELAAVSARAQS